MARIHDKPPQQSLKQIAIFSDLSPEAMDKVGHLLRWSRYQRDENILEFGDDTSDVFFIADGHARVTIYSIEGKAVSFRELEPGDVFGEYAAIDSQPRSASVEARSSCLVGAIPAFKFRTFFKAEPSVMEALLKHLVKELRELTTRVYEFSTLCVNNRIQAEVLRLARRAEAEGNEACIEPPPTHADIASRISTHREAVTRELNRLSRMGIIQQQKNVLLVMDIDRLDAMVHEAAGE